MLYDENVTHLQEAVERHRFIRNIRYHRLPDGTLDYAGNRKVWERATEDLIKTPLGPTGAWFAFVPVETGAERTEEIRKRGTILIAHGGGFNWRTGCEAGNAAWYFHRRGFNTAILSYRLQLCLENLTHNGHFFYYDGSFVVIMNELSEKQAQDIAEGFVRNVARRLRGEAPFFCGIGSRVK